jgi:tRNA A37 methylthiotransferase MiaB
MRNDAVGWEKKGSLNNIQQLVNAGKKALVYLAPNGTFYKLSTEQNLRDLLQHCDQSAIRQAQHQIGTKLPAADLPPSASRQPHRPPRSPQTPVTARAK